MKNINISVDEEDEWSFIIDVSDIIDVRESLLIDDSNEKCFLNIIIEKEKQLLDRETGVYNGEWVLEYSSSW
jgi:hypothetical protein